MAILKSFQWKVNISDFCGVATLRPKPKADWFGQYTGAAYHITCKVAYIATAATSTIYSVVNKRLME